MGTGPWTLPAAPQDVLGAIEVGTDRRRCPRRQWRSPESSRLARTVGAVRGDPGARPSRRGGHRPRTIHAAPQEVVAIREVDTGPWTPHAVPEAVAGLFEVDRIVGAVRDAVGGRPTLRDGEAHERLMEPHRRSPRSSRSVRIVGCCMRSRTRSAGLCPVDSRVRRKSRGPWAPSTAAQRHR